MPQEVFRHCETKSVRRKTRYPLLYMKRFDTPSYVKHWTDAHKLFRHCETIKFQLKKLISTTLHQNFLYPKLSETLKGCPRNFSARWHRTFSQEKRDIPYQTWNFSIPQLFWNIERMPTESLGTVRPKIFAEKTWYLLLCIKFFDPPKFLKHWRDAHKIIRHCET